MFIDRKIELEQLHFLPKFFRGQGIPRLVNPVRMPFPFQPMDNRNLPAPSIPTCRSAPAYAAAALRLMPGDVCQDIYYNNCGVSPVQPLPLSQIVGLHAPFVASAQYL